MPESCFVALFNVFYLCVCVCVYVYVYIDMCVCVWQVDAQPVMSALSAVSVLHSYLNKAEADMRGLRNKLLLQSAAAAAATAESDISSSSSSGSGSAAAAAVSTVVANSAPSLTAAIESQAQAQTALSRRQRPGSDASSSCLDAVERCITATRMQARMCLYILMPFTLRHRLMFVAQICFVAFYYD